MLKKEGKPVDEDSIPLPPQTESSGLGTTLRPIYGNPQDSHFPVPKEVEAYLYDVKKELFDYIEQIKVKDPRKIHGLKSKIDSMLCNLRKRDDLTLSQPTRLTPTSSSPPIISKSN
jgi:hypothetical protein